jgi:hypothetical protein
MIRARWMLPIAKREPGEVPGGIITYEKRAHIMTSWDDGIGKVNTTATEWRYHIYVDLWILKLSILFTSSD